MINIVESSKLVIPNDELLTLGKQLLQSNQQEQIIAGATIMSYIILINKPKHKRTKMIYEIKQAMKQCVDVGKHAQ
jgi:hypothetical protein